MEVKTISAVLEKKIDETADIKRFILKTEAPFLYQAGQWGFLQFEKNGQNFSKPLSFCGSPKDGFVEFATIISNSEYKQNLNSLALGDKMSIKGPMGNFTLKDLNNSPVAFLAGGIGITPFMGMIKDSHLNNINLDAVLFYANRTPNTIAYKKDLELLESKIKKLKVVHLLSNLEEKDKSTWQGETGYIRKEIILKYMDNPQNRHFFIVGPPPFVNAMKDLLLNELQVPSNQVILEQFAGY